MTATHFSGPLAVGSGAYKSLTAAYTVDPKQDNGKTFGLNLAGGFTVTLPALSKVTTGFKLRFRCEVAPTTAYIISASSNLDTIVGSFSTATAHTTAADIEATAGGDTIEFVAASAVIGDYITLETNGTLWFVTGHCSLPASLTISG